jgi:hypothetical protein
MDKHQQQYIQQQLLHQQHLLQQQKVTAHFGYGSSSNPTTQQPKKVTPTTQLPDNYKNNKDTTYLHYGSSSAKTPPIAHSTSTSNIPANNIQNNVPNNVPNNAPNIVHKIPTSSSSGALNATANNYERTPT